MCYNIVTMDSFDFNEYSEKSREVLVRVLEEIREQFLVGNESPQFWFYLNRMEDKSLTESIVEKWLLVLSDKGILHYYKPNYSEWEEAVVFNHKRLEERYEWNPQIITSYILNRSPDPHSRPNFVLDIYDTNIAKLIDTLSRKSVWGKFSIDTLGRFYYDDTLLDGINSSPLKKTILSEFLLADKHTVSANKIEKVVAKDKDEGEGEGEEASNRRNRNISEINKELRSVSHDIDIKTHKSNHKADCYELIITEESV